VCLPVGAREKGELGDEDELQLQKLWYEGYPTDVCYRSLYERFALDRKKGYTGTMRNWEPNARLTEKQWALKNRLNSVQFIKRAELDGTMFCTVEWSDGKLSDNSYIKVTYKEEEADEKSNEIVSYGRINYMFVAQLHKDGPEDVVVAGDWYNVVGINPVSKNIQVRYNPNFSSEHLTFLRNCTPQNLHLVASDPFGVRGAEELYDVIDD
jgi:hypothetical protein